jgi:hypothetical protein
VPEIISGKVCSSRGKFYQPLGNEPPRARTALAHLVERRSNLICYHLTCSLSERNFAPSAKEEAVPSIVPSLPLSALHDKLSPDYVLSRFIPHVW